MTPPRLTVDNGPPDCPDRAEAVRRTLDAENARRRPFAEILASLGVCAFVPRDRPHTHAERRRRR